MFSWELRTLISMDVCMYELMYKWMSECMGRWVNIWMNGWMDAVPKKRQRSTRERYLIGEIFARDKTTTPYHLWFGDACDDIVEFKTLKWSIPSSPLRLPSLLVMMLCVDWLVSPALMKSSCSKSSGLDSPESRLR